ncbi:MAG: tyrosine-type recombinase/integrase [Bacteroides thetaiotaomicron]
MWMFSFYCCGMNMADIFLLKYKNIKGNLFTYYRQKTHGSSKSQLPIEVYITEPIAAIIKKWGNKEKSPNNYIFTIYEDSMTAEEMFQKKKNIVRMINGYIDWLGRKIGIKERLNTSTARHSYATILKKDSVSL